MHDPVAVIPCSGPGKVCQPISFYRLGVSIILYTHCNAPCYCLLRQLDSRLTRNHSRRLFDRSTVLRQELRRPRPLGILESLADADATENETKIRATQKTEGLGLVLGKKFEDDTLIRIRDRAPDRR